MLCTLAIIVVFYTTCAIAEVNVLEFKYSDTLHFKFKASDVDRFHNCLCDEENIGCRMQASDTVSVDSVKQNSTDPSRDKFMNRYYCNFQVGQTVDINCTRAVKELSCNSVHCEEMCFTNKTSCDLSYVNVRFDFSKIVPVHTYDPVKLHNFSCKSDICSQKDSDCPGSGGMTPLFSDVKMYVLVIFLVRFCFYLT